MKVLVASASRHGATRGIAERIAQTLEHNGLEVTLKRADEVNRVAEYDAFVIDMGRWLKQATQFVRTHRAVLAGRPTRLFSSGPIGPEMVDKNGRDVLETTRPREFVELAAAIQPREMRVFFGAYDPNAAPVGIAEKFMALTPARSALPAGDFRDWPQIEAWAEGIAHELRPAVLVAANA